jgi:hypothetical protein
VKILRSGANFGLNLPGATVTFWGGTVLGVRAPDPEPGL